jgi:electron transport complex protein RnfD
VTSRSPDLVLSTPPFVRAAATTPRIMLEVLAVALVVLAAACWHFGVSALLVVAAASAGAVVTEWLFGNGDAAASLSDYSALTTGVLLGLTLPPGLPLWMAFLGGTVGIGLGKLIWGGLGQNFFNPALVGRAFLQSAFPTAITTWSPPAAAGGLLAAPSSLFALPLMRGSVDAVSSATPLGLAKFEHEITDLGALLLGQTTGSLGETNAVLLVLCGLWLGARRLFDWRLPLATLLSVAVLGGVLHLASPATHPPPAFMLLSGRPRDHPHHAPRRVDLWGRGGRAGGADPPVRRPSRGRDVRDPADERADAPPEPVHPAATLRSGAMTAREAVPLRMVATLALAGFCSGIAVVGVYLLTKPRIDRNRAEALQAAIFRVLEGASTRTPFALRGDEIVRIEAAGDVLPEDEVVYGGYDEAGALVGFAIPAEGGGFQDTIKLLYGYDPARHRIEGMQVLESRETPGLGD